MRIVVDLQGAQTTASKNRGIGRYTLALAQALHRNAREHEVLFTLNGLFADTIDPIRALLDDQVPQETIRVYTAPGPVAMGDPANHWRRKSAELVREAFLASLRPDMVVATSVFEGLGDDAITSVGLLGRTIPTAVVLYDLIPLLNPKIYLADPMVAEWYEGKVDHLRRADLLLAISESSRLDGIRCLGVPPAQAVTISTAADAHFRPRKLAAAREKEIRERYGLTRPFVMYTGGIDFRKNIEGLIRAYAKLPRRLRQAHQLAIVCSIQPPTRAALQSLAADCGLGADELVLTGFVPEKDLLALYNLCQAFAFPSWHEGFGLPALEAMCCGRAVIAANTSSLPELIGREDALFDPHSQPSITAKLERVLTDSDFRHALERHGLLQSQRFSWDATARRALAAFEQWQAQQGSARPRVASTPVRPRLAYVSPVPPERTGIADYSAELLPELARHYEVDVVTPQETVSVPWTPAAPIRSPAWFEANAHRFDRVLYHFGNSQFHAHMFELLEKFPGAVVLHDFFLGHIAEHRGNLAGAAESWPATLYREHGYPALLDLQEGPVADLPWKYPCNQRVLSSAVGVIVHAEHSRRLARQRYGPEAGADWSVIPLLRTPAHEVDRAAARSALGIDPQAFVVCSFGMLGPGKLNHRLLGAWTDSSLAKETACHLFFVGENPPNEYGERIEDQIADAGRSARIRITGWADMARFRLYLAAADVGVQLRTMSRGETSAAVLDCMNHGLATIVNANGSMADLPEDCVLKLPDEFTDDELAQALERLWRDPGLRERLAQRARERILESHAPRDCADQYVQAIESFYWRAATGPEGLAKAVGRVVPTSEDPQAWAKLALCVMHSITPALTERQLLVDVSELVQRDSKSGIQRVVRSILSELLRHPPPGYRVEPVFTGEVEGDYRYARRFTARFLDMAEDLLEDGPIEFRAGDVFLGLDLQHFVVTRQQAFYQRLRDAGASVYFVVYDLLPVLLDDAFPPAMYELHRRWLEALSRTDGVVCISRSVAGEMLAWLASNAPPRQRPFRVGYFHLGADIEASLPTSFLPDDAEAVLSRLEAAPTFLMVGTVEPRKSYAQALGAFESLWAAGRDVNLVIVGQQGWMVEELAERLRAHSQLGRRLFWLKGISDEYLERVYAASACLISASLGEGFGLPLIEAAKHELPILARDLPVFREVGGEHATYFEGEEPHALAAAVEAWLALHAKGGARPSIDLPWLTWAESTRQLLDVIVGGQWLAHWIHDGAYRYVGADQRLLSIVGKRRNRELHTSGTEGHLLYGPYAPLPAGRYRVRIRGEARALGHPAPRADVAVRRAKHVLAECTIHATVSPKVLAEMDIDLDTPAQDLEVRLWVPADADLTVNCLELVPRSVLEKEYEGEADEVAPAVAVHAVTNAA